MGERKESVLGKILRVRQVCTDLRLLPENIFGGAPKTNTSPKIDALLSLIEGEMGPDEKGVIFSEWTSFLDLLEDALDANGHSFNRIDGTMAMTDRGTLKDDGLYVSTSYFVSDLDLIFPLTHLIFRQNKLWAISTTRM